MSALVVTVDGTPVGTTTADALGGWAVTPAAPLSEGAHSVTATATVATNDASDTNAFEIDLSTAVAITEPADAATIIDSTPDIVGTGEPGATIVVSIDGTEVGTTTVEADGTWRVALTTALDNGDHTATAAATDTFGHTDTATATFTVDARTSVAITAPANGSDINDPMPTITGTAAAGASVEVTVDGTVLGTVTADASGMWSIPTTSALSDGEHVVTAEATDAFGNRAEDTSTFTVDTETTVEITVATAETIEGTGEPGASVEITIDGTVVGTVVVDSEGTWVLGLDPALGPGTHEVTATSTDEAGNTATDTAVVTVDTPDGGVDAGGPDAGGGDAGVPDASMSDGGLDGGVVPTGGGLAGGALCSARPGQPSGGSWILALALAALVVIRRRTR